MTTKTNPRLTWFWQLSETNPILFHHATKVYTTIFISRTLKREYKLQALIPALAWAGIVTAEVRIKNYQPTLVAKDHEIWKLKHILRELEEIKTYTYEEEKMGAIASILNKYKRAPKTWWQLHKFGL